MFKFFFVLSLISTIVLAIVTINNIAFLPYLVSSILSTLYAFAILCLYRQVQDDEKKVAELSVRLKKVEEYDVKKEIADLKFKIARLEEKLKKE